MLARRALRSLKPLLWIGFVFLLSYFAADFSWNQSWALALVCGGLLAAVSQLARHLDERDRFEPFEVTIHPKWKPLLHDYRLVKNDDQVKALYSRAKKLPPALNALDYGFTFYVLQPSRFADFRGLVYSSNSFRTEVDLMIPVEGSIINSALDEATEILETELTAFVRWGIDAGFELGIEVDEDWWNRISKKLENEPSITVKADTEALFGTVRLTAATLPYEAFGMYLGGEYKMRRIEREQKERETILTRFGWLLETPHYMETDPPYRLEHKYFTVIHRAIWPVSQGIARSLFRLGTFTRLRMPCSLRWPASIAGPRSQQPRNSSSREGSCSRLH